MYGVYWPLLIDIGVSGSSVRSSVDHDYLTVSIK